MVTSHGRVLPFRPAEALESPDRGTPPGVVDPVALGRRVRHHRRQAGLTLAQLGEKVGLSASALSLLENGRREPKVSVLADVALAGTLLPGIVKAVFPARRAGLGTGLTMVSNYSTWLQQRFRQSGR